MALPDLACASSGSLAAMSEATCFEGTPSGTPPEGGGGAHFAKRRRGIAGAAIVDAAPMASDASTLEAVLNRCSACMPNTPLMSTCTCICLLHHVDALLCTSLPLPCCKQGTRDKCVRLPPVPCFFFLECSLTRPAQTAGGTEV